MTVPDERGHHLGVAGTAQASAGTRVPAGNDDRGATARTRVSARAWANPSVDAKTASVPTLVESALEGHQWAWEELVGRFGGMISSVGRRYGLSAADVNELQQVTWLRLIENLHRIEQPERVGGWLATTARRESLQILRRAARHTTGADQILANLPDMHGPDLDTLPSSEAREALLRAWERLKPRCRELLSLLVSDDVGGYRALSELLSIPVGSIGPTRGRCLEHLRRLVAEEGVTEY